MKLSSPAFQHDGMIPKKYTCEGENASPPLDISGVPEGTASLALIAYDPDVPKELQEKHGAPAEWPHWVVFNLDPSTTTLAEGDRNGTHGNNGSGQPQYEGPCPPKEYAPSRHRYYFKLCALDITLDVQEGASRDKVEGAMTDHVLAQTDLLGHYEKTA